MEQYKVIIPVAAGDVPILKYSIGYLKRNISYKAIIVVGNTKVYEKLEELQLLEEGVSFFNEDDIISYHEVSEYIGSITKNDLDSRKRTGWYLQQFLKMQYARICEEEYYIVWDADTVLLQSVNFFLNGKPVFDLKEEYHKPYFATMQKLIPDLGRMKDCSFISEHMIISTKIMRELLDEIEKNAKEDNLTFWKCVLSAIDKDKMKYSGFSEFETYGNYCMLRYPKAYEMHRYKSFREGSRYFDIEKIDDNAAWIAKFFQAISFEKTMEPSKVKGLFQNKLVHRVISIRLLFALVTRIRRIKKK